MAISCAVGGGCPSDYVGIAIAIFCFLLLLSRTIGPCIIHKIPRTNGSGFWIPVIQVFASFNLLLSIVISANLLKFQKHYHWQSCYIWAVWVEGPLAFGLLLSCRITQVFQLYYIFVKKHLPPIRSYIFLPLIILPWIALAALIHAKKPLSTRCHMGVPWVTLFVSLHTVYVAALIGYTRAIRHIEFRFDELRDLWQGILVSSLSIGVWVAAYILNEIHDEISWLQIVSRFVLLITASTVILVLFTMSSSEPLLSQISLRRRESLAYETMGQALGITDSGLLTQREAAAATYSKEPLDKLLQNKRFRQSFMAFADSCYAGETVHFFEEVHESSRISENDAVKRIYMARHIIENYIVAGAVMEVNISHRTRQEILTTTNLAHPNLFNNALNEVMQLIKQNLAKDYWSSMFFIKFKEEASMKCNEQELEPMSHWNFSPRLSSVHGADDPFNQEHLSKGSDHDGHDSDV